MKLSNFRISTIKFKLITIFFTLTTIPLGIVGIISYVQSSNTISNLTTSSTMQLAYQLSENISSIYDGTEKFLKIGESDNVKAFLKAQNGTRYEERIIKDLFKLNQSGFKYNKSIKDIYIISDNGKVISSRKGVYNLDRAEFEANPIYNELIYNKGTVRIMQNYTSEYSSENNNSNIVSIGTTIMDRSSDNSKNKGNVKENGKVIGAIIIDFDTSVMEAICNKMEIGKSGFFYILDNDNQMVFKPPKRYIEHIEDYNWNTILKHKKGSSIQEIGGKDTLFVYETTNNLRANWKVIGQVPLDDIMKDAYRVKNITIIIIVICMILSGCVFIFLTDTITRPLRNLINKMKQAEQGNLTVRAYSSSDDEISDLCVSFNRMIEEINSLLAKNIKEQDDLKKAELKALQAQINPHFLYNTLDAIVWMAEGNDKNKIIELVTALSRFFRIALSRGTDWITVEREVEHSSNYLYIQKMRYGDILDYSIDMSPDTVGCKMLKLILQPIIENAIYHGIKNKRGGGQITLKGYIKEDNLVFEVADDGIGMNQEQLEKLRSKLLCEQQLMLDDKNLDNGYGLINVNERIKLYYGRKYGLTVESEISKGTIIFISIPVER
jgi:two-component system sensor histidine kinase YesM